jgi:hypothetical protein
LEVIIFKIAITDDILFEADDFGNIIYEILQSKYVNCRVFYASVLLTYKTNITNRFIFIKRRITNGIN